MTIRKNMTAIGRGREYDGMKIVIITATNVGRRPISISGFAASLLFKKGQVETDILHDVRPPLPCEITEGKTVSAYVNQENLDFESISCWFAWDSAGKHYRSNVAPWYKRWVSAYRYKYANTRKANKGLNR